MAIALLDFVQNVLRVAKRALGDQAERPASGGLPREAHIVAHCIRKEEGHTFTELGDRLSLVPVVCEHLGLHPDTLPLPTTFYHSLDRYAMYVWQALLRASAQQLRQSGYVALDSTFFERKQASPYYIQRRERTVKTIEATTLTDTASLAVVDVHCCIEREHDTTAVPRVVRRNAGDLRSLAADRGFDSKRLRDQHRDDQIRPLIPHRKVSALKKAHNDRLDRTSYNRRWMVETIISSIKRTPGCAERARSWALELREMLLKAAVCNIQTAIRRGNQVP